jgi:hypothetical protein
VVVGLEAAAAEEVADRVDAPGHVVDEEDPDEAAPQVAGERTLEGAGERVAQECRDHQAGAEQPREPAADLADDRVLEQVRGEAPLLRLALGHGQPAHVGVVEAAQRAAQARAVPMRRVRVALVVGEGVVLAVIGHPVDHRALHGH